MEHRRSEKQKYQSLRSYTSMVEDANSEKVEVTGVCDIVPSLHEDDEDPRNITLSNVLYAPKLGGNLLSIGRIEENGFKVEFLNGEAEVTGKEWRQF
ncbi:hypothetical protein AVEN_129350-1 [Araneus ventricosus]|uniref:Retrovirus-related Pol polyprotein from transposon TNT 1-94-like beta-barrel domain-containing protein n=1 Tax=Araneus ventricosus TaxID=182803 RepID=A0A4Y2EHH9_ARAVE|nr:hypothetical protein AVEN_92518-1 [Araneus ventricosus]GBM28592.1 hypothetical protein AVEN_129350-1 [Araneus ventricosus]